MADKPRLGFVGLGFMGSAFTQRLLECGYQVTVWNLEPDRVPPLVALGAVAARSPAAVTQASDVVLMCVLHTEAVEQCVFGPQGIAAAGHRGQLLVDHSTADPEATRTFAARLKAETGMGWIDAPVSGGPDAARSGTLAIMAGGNPADITAIQPIMDHLAATFTRMGPVGAGQTTKIINQAIVGTGYVVMAEALKLAEAAGIDAARLPACLAGGHADSNLLRKLYPRMEARAFDPPQSFARQLSKDMNAVKDFAQALGLHLPIVESAAHRYAEFVKQGGEFQDSAAIVRLYEQKP